MSMAAKKKKPEPDPTPEEEDKETASFLLVVAENALREATHKAAMSAHPIQLEAITDALLGVESAKNFLNKDPDYFVNKLDD